MSHFYMVKMQKTKTQDHLSDTSETFKTYNFGICLNKRYLFLIIMTQNKKKK